MSSNRPQADVLNYGPAGATHPGDAVWSAVGEGYRRYERTVVIGHGDADWRAAADAVLRWEVKRRSGFSVALRSGADESSVAARPGADESSITAPSGADESSITPPSGVGERVVEGAEYRITAAWGPLAVREPVRVVAVVDTADRCGFAYGTLPGHPVSGEEAFVVHRAADGTVALTLRSLTRPAPDGPWRPAFPLLLLAQRHFRRRYLRALVP